MSIEASTASRPPRGDGRSSRVIAALPGALLACALAGAAEVPADSPADSLAAAISGGKASLGLRYRYEHVDQDGFTQDADASTLRLRLNYRTREYRNWTGFAEFDYVGELFPDDFNSGGGTSPGRLQYPVVADPDGADLNQLYIDFTGIDATRLRAGRQRILRNNQRFVGGVGWRQNEQTYDGISVRYDGLRNVELEYAWVIRVNRIFGDRSPVGRNDSNTHLLDASIGLPEGWTLQPYGYYIDDEDVPAFSTMTVGARLVGGIAVGDETLALTGEFATQADAASAPVDYTASYLRFDASLPVAGQFDVGVGYEVLGGDGNEAGAAFGTPLATLHAFQGWADQFLATPDAGVEDLCVTARWTPSPWTVQATWHRFEAEAGNADWGDELDVSVGRRFGDRYGVLLKAALFDADDPAFGDVDKFWIMLTADY
ncbi:MAG: alginate export family protein [Woeseiaceae bacterium]|nr:alginate export family protein [Woeseiaceae bacterium]